MSNILAQKNEIKRLEVDDMRRRQEEEQVEKARGEEEKEKSIEEFEKVMMGMEGTKKQPVKNAISTEDGKPHRKHERGIKRKFELDEDEMLKNALAERAKARIALDEEKAFFFPNLQRLSKLMSKFTVI